jgi:hypothetical protein
MSAIAAAFALTVALVVQDQAPLRAAAHDSAARQATLAPGDWLEVRGEHQGYLQVYDHRRERPGYVRPAAVRSYALEEATAPKLGALVEFFRDAPGEESLGIGYVALFLRAVPANGVGPEAFDALGTMAERLARRASARAAGDRGRGEASLAGQVEAAESYGVHFARFDDGDHTRVCYDGEAYRRVLALGGTGAMRARAAMGLTDPACVDPSLGPAAGLASAKDAAQVLASVDPSALTDVPAFERARLRLRRSMVQSELAYYAARAGDAALAKPASEAARRELALADRAALADEDRLAYDEAALRAAAVRWADAAPPAANSASALDVAIAPGDPGQTCVKVKKRGATGEPFAHCTYGLVWPSSVRVAPHDAAVVVAVQPLVGWSELLVLHPGPQGWAADTMTPATIDPELGYVELAGFSPDGGRILVVRESRASGPLGSPNTLAPWMNRAFQVVTTDALRIEKQASTRASFATFRRWESPEWRGATLALR